MKFIEWCDLFRIGNSTIDKQHQVLFEITNKFHSEVHDKFSKKLIIQTLNELINYAQMHFSTEEDITEKLGLPKEMLACHKDEHEKLVMEIFQLNEDLLSGKISTMHEIENFLTKWLILHILIEDRNYKDHF